MSNVDDWAEVLADGIMRSAHMTFNAQRGRKMVRICIKILQDRIHEIQPKKATSKYYKSRYSKKGKDHADHANGNIDQGESKNTP